MSDKRDPATNKLLFLVCDGKECVKKMPPGKDCGKGWVSVYQQKGGVGQEIFRWDYCEDCQCKAIGIWKGKYKLTS